MNIAMIGLGKMGLNMSRRLLRGRHRVVAYDRNKAAVAAAARVGAVGAASLPDAVEKLKGRKIVWLMLPAGAPVCRAVEELAPLLGKGDVVVDGGNSDFKDAAEHSARLAERGSIFLDAGVSGGVWGLQEGYCLMVGGPKAAYKFVEPVFKTLAPKEGCARVGESGAGHFVKTVHNGVEYALMQAYAEGFELLESSPYKPDLRGVSELWNRGSVIRSWLLELAARAFEKDPQLKKISGWVDDSGHGRRTVQAAVDGAVPAPAIAMSLFTRFRSRQDNPFSDRVLAALRREFGGHAVKKRRR